MMNNKRIGKRALLLLSAAVLAVAGSVWPGKQQAAFSQELLEGGNMAQIKVATYNIHIGKDADDNLDLDRTIATLRESGAEIIGLQEVERRSPRSGFVDQAKRIAEGLGMEYRFEAGLKIWPFEFGNVLLSKYPITSAERIELPSSKENRVALLATLDVHDHPLNVLVTHLGLQRDERQEHARQLADTIGGLDGPLVLMGDFNTTPDGAELKPLLDTLRPANDQPLVTFPGLGQQIDSIFVSRHFKVQGAATIDSTASDHLPLIAELSL